MGEPHNRVFPIIVYNIIYFRLLLLISKHNLNKHGAHLLSQYNHTVE